VYPGYTEVIFIGDYFCGNVQLPKIEVGTVPLPAKSASGIKRAEKLWREAILSHARQLAESREDAARFSDCPSALAE